MLTYIFYGLFIISCLVLVVSVLLQPGKANAGALFSSSVSSTAFGPRGTQSILSKITIGASAAFMLLALMLSLPAITGQRSVLQSADPETETPVTQPSPTATENPSPPASPAANSAPATAAPSPSAQK